MNSCVGDGPLSSIRNADRKVGPIKIVVWDLDNTLWDGILMERGDPPLLPTTKLLIQELDELGVLQSIASRNDHVAAMGHLSSLGIADYFLAPQIGWSAKSASIQMIAMELNVGLESILFVDDDPFELEEVAHALPPVQLLGAAHIGELTNIPGLRPERITSEGRRRRQLYVENKARAESERSYSGPAIEFMATLGLEITVREAAASDLTRAHELVTRTNQLNSTGTIFSENDLIDILSSIDHRCLIVESKDRFGDYGIVGFIIIQFQVNLFTIRLMVVSCRVLSRGVGPLLLNHMGELAERAGCSLNASFKNTGRNRPMKIALMMSGFKAPDQPGLPWLQDPLKRQKTPDWVKIHSLCEWPQL